MFEAHGIDLLLFFILQTLSLRIRSLSTTYCWQVGRFDEL